MKAMMKRMNYSLAVHFIEIKKTNFKCGFPQFGTVQANRIAQGKARTNRIHAPRNLTLATNPGLSLEGMAMGTPGMQLQILISSSSSSSPSPSVSWQKKHASLDLLNNLPPFKKGGIVK